jgi:hypothetical protein
MQDLVDDDVQMQQLQLTDVCWWGKVAAGVKTGIELGRSAAEQSGRGLAGTGKLASLLACR